MCVFMFIFACLLCMLVGNVATASVCGDAQDAEKKTTEDLEQIFGECL